MTSPRDPWQQGGSPPPYPSAPPPGATPWGTPPGGFPQTGYPHSQRDFAEPARPVAVECAFWIAIVVPLLVTVLYAVNSMLTQSFLTGTVGSDSGDPALNQEVVGLMAGISFAVFLFVVVFEVVLTALWITFGFKLRAGRTWARVVLTVFAAFWALYSAGGLITGEPGLTGALAADTPTPAGIVALGYAQSAVGLLAMVAFLVLVHLPASNRYFQSSRFAR
ncbi:hypothetical protein OOZ19_01350 [Saccharopolyspora sp. NFXS83]|uniref:hypothetical protein n=1 Tax=Saccharopolyspora sp. NFXS83 TaxID=2993560 RepID=UPI00224A9049|nr:hypothetical protein [Saccharopolyspora sp. NFXS83]MCX2728875.1 hypothetical protein [Saccharopolyspora sp. NFXS83]